METERLVLRLRREDDAPVLRQLWAERDPRVPAHRRLDATGRPSIDDIAAQIRSEGTGLLAVETKSPADVIGYCGIVFHGNGAPDEPELAFELLRSTHGRGYATEAGQAVVDWTRSSGYERMWATVREWNLASRRVLTKLGFVETGEVESDDLHGHSLLTVRLL